MGYFDEMQGQQQDFDTSGFTSAIQRLLASQQPQQDVMGGAMQQQQAIPGLPQKIVQALGGAEAPQNGAAQDMLAARFNQEPSIQDYGESLATAGGDKFVTPQSALLERLKGMSEVAKNEAYAQSGGNHTPAAMQMAEQVAQLEAIGTPEALAKAELIKKFAKTADTQAEYGKGFIKNADGTFSVAPGYAGAAGQLEYSKKIGDQNAIIDTAAEIERQKKIGTGEITPQQTLNKGQNQVTSMINQIGGYYDTLDKAGGITNPQNSTLDNIGAYFGNTGAGQTVGKMAGTDTQSIRNSIAQSRPLLINAIRTATGMSAKAMDSNAELQFYIKAATDPTLDIKANKAALKMLDSLYGLSGAQGGSNNAAPNQPTTQVRYNAKGQKATLVNGQWVVE